MPKQNTEESVRRRNFLTRVASRIRTAAHLSRAKRSTQLSEPTIGLVLDEHELYHRQSSTNGPVVEANRTSGEQPALGGHTSKRFILSYGNIHFWKNYSFGEAHPYIKVSHDANVEDVAYIMHKNWRLEAPRIVTTIISDMSPLDQWTNSRQMAAFKKGLMKAANSTHMWILTNGVNVGAAKLVGDAVYQEMRENKAYDRVGNNQKLNVVGIIREEALRYDVEKERVELHNEGNEEDRYELNENHSHYIVVKDSTVSKTGINLFALRMCQYLSSVGTRGEFAQSDRADTPDLCSLTNLEIPVISVVISGGYECARLVLDHIKRRNPVVVLRGSGGLADLLAFALLEAQRRTDSCSEWDAEFVESFLKPELGHKIANRFPRLRDNALNRNVFRDRIIECVRLSRQSGGILLSVLNLHNSSCNLENLSEYLLMALLKSQHSNQKDKTPDVELLLKDLYLTLDWNCPHVARNEVIGRDPTCVLKLEKSMFETALILDNREEFIDLFLSNGFLLHKFLTPKRLKRLFKRIHRQEFFRSVCWEGVLGHSFGTELNKDFIDIDLNWLIESTTDLSRFVSSQTLHLNVMALYPIDAASAERKALALLTLWSLYGNRHKLAKVFWKHSDQPIHLGLVISMALERLSWYVGEHNLKTELTNPSKVFADYSIGVLDLCFAQNENKANDVLSEESIDWNYKTAVDIAANARLRSFLAHPCCQKWLTNTFLGAIRIREMSWGLFSIPPAVKIVLSALFILPMYIWVRFRPPLNQMSDDVVEVEDEKDDEVREDEFREEDTTIEEKNSILPKDIQAMNNKILKQSKHYSTLIRQRELFIRRQPPLWKMVCLMWSAPITKFWTFQFFYIIFLALFSLALVYPGCGHFYLDVSVCVWAALILIEYIRRTIILYRKYTSVPLVFKCIEIIAIVAFVIVYTSGRVFGLMFYSAYTMKVLLSFALLYFYYRLFAVYLPISPTLGPLLYRLRLMVTIDFVNFMRMALLVICSSGIVIQALLFPDAELSLSMFSRAFHRAFFTLFITPLEDFKADDDCIATTKSHYCRASEYNKTYCASNGFWPYFFSVQYFIFLKLILMTLLYALFASTASKLQTETDNIWKFQRYILVVDFANRLPLPAPLSILCYIYFIFKYCYRLITCFYCRKRDQIDGKSNLMLPMSEESIKTHCILSQDDYSFWRHLAHEFYNKQMTKEEDIQYKQWECVQTISEEVEYEKKMLRQLKGKVSELERMVTQSHVYLEKIQHLFATKHGLTPDTTPVHFLSRHSPYLGTRVQRVPIPDKYVAWEVMWVDYEPVVYTKAKQDFSDQLLVDEDILLLQELAIEEITSKLPVLKWNTSAMNAAGITIDRRSWICDKQTDARVVYRLNNGIPVNPMGRTGLRGKGVLPRWGPNHYVALIITRWKSTENVLEFVIERSERRDQLALPVRFIGGEDLYSDFQLLFKTEENWDSMEAMTRFFAQTITTPTAPTPVPILPSPTTPTTPPEPFPGLKCERLSVGYWDDPHNTDNAWKELELWHVHYTTQHECLSERMQTARIHWRIVTEDVFAKLSLSESQLLQTITQTMKATIL